MSILKSAALAAGALAMAVAAGAALDKETAMAADNDKMERTVSVSATGMVAAETDVAQISAGVVTEADSAKDAMARNSVVMRKLIEGLKASGIQAPSMSSRVIRSPRMDGRLWSAATAWSTRCGSRSVM